MKQKVAPVEAETDPWETGDLGRSLDHARIAEDAGEDEAIDQAMNLRQISIRLEQSLIDAYKLIASRNKNTGYQTLMRQCLKRFAVAELKQIAREMEAEVEATEKAQKEAASQKKCA